MFPYVLETLVEVWKNSKLRGNTRPTGSCSHFNFSFSQTSTRVSIKQKTENVFYFLIWAFNGGLDYWKLLYPQSLPECRTIITIRVQKRKVRNYLRSTSATLEFPTQTLLLFYSETDIVDEINIDRAVYNSGQTLDVFRITFSAFWLYEYLSIP